MFIMEKLKRTIIQKLIWKLNKSKKYTAKTFQSINRSRSTDVIGAFQNKDIENLRHNTISH